MKLNLHNQYKNMSHKKSDSYFKDMVGTKNGRLTIIKDNGYFVGGDRQYTCKCSCGKVIIRRRSLLRQKGREQNCGCLKMESWKRMRRNIKGMKYGRLIVLKFAGMKEGKNQGNASWLCECLCGNKKIIREANLISGRTLSCGCLAVEKATKHGESGTLFHTKWVALSNLARTGAYGMEWKNYLQFRKDMKESFDKAIASGIKNPRINRLDISKGFTRANCVWGRRSQVQTKNLLQFADGSALTVQEVAQKAGISRQQVSNRLMSGWTVEELVIPNQHTKSNVKRMRANMKKNKPWLKAPNMRKK